MTDATTPEQPRTAAGRALPCTFHRRNEPVCGEPADNRAVHSAEDEKMRHGTHIFRHEVKDRFRLPVEVGVCSICGDDEPFHVHNSGQRIEDYFTVGRGQTDFQAAQAWKHRAIEAQARPAVASEGLWAALERLVEASHRVQPDPLGVRVAAEVPRDRLIALWDAEHAARAALASDAGRVGALDVEHDFNPFHLSSCPACQKQEAAYEAERQGAGTLTIPAIQAILDEAQQ